MKPRFLGKVALVVLVVVPLAVLIRFTGLERGTLTRGEKLFRDFMAPLQSGVISVSYGLSNAWEGVFNYSKLKGQNEELQTMVDQLQQEVNRLQEYQMENARLRKLLNFQQAGGEYYQLLSAQVIGRDPSNWYRTLTINRGTAHGVDRDMAVITSEGLVGRIIAVSDRTSEVLLVVDRESAVGVLVQQTRTNGVLEGAPDGSGLMQLVHLPHDAPVEPNQTVVTSGLGSIFPKGLRIGFVTKIVTEPNGLLKRAWVNPLVDFDRLEEVMVVTGVKGEG